MCKRRRAEAAKQTALRSHLFAVDALVEYDTDWPDVDFGGDFWRVFADDEALRGEVPVSSGPLGGQVHPMVRRVVLRVHDLGQAEVGDLDVAAHVASSQQYVACQKRIDFTWVLAKI